MQTKWKLNKYFYQSLEDSQIKTDIKTIKSKVSKFKKKFQGQIKTLDIQGLLDFFQADSDLSYLVNKINLYLLYQSSLDTQNQKVLKKIGDLNLLFIDLANELIFVAQEFKELGKDRLIKLSKEPKLRAYQNFFWQKAKNLEYLLDEKTEFALNLKSSGSESSLIKLYEELTGSFVFKFPKKLLKNLDTEEMLDLTLEEVSSLRMDFKEEVRKEAYKVIRETFGSKANQITLGNIYNGIVKDWVNEIKIRKYPTEVMSQRNISEQMPGEAIQMLINKTKENYSLYQRYLKAKAKILAEDKLEPWNIFAPIGKLGKDIKFEKAYDMVIATLENFDTEVADFAKDMFYSGRVDVYPKKGKRGGAYSSSAKDFESFVMLNYTGKLTDVATIAHELGHAFHGKMSQEQPEQVYDTVLCLAETASVFNETLLAEDLIKNITDKEQKLFFLDHRLTDILSTVFTQVRFVCFEKLVHESIFAGKDLVYSDFNNLWKKVSKEQIGSTVKEYSEEKNVGWSAIPHIYHTPFYCYSYAFGNLLSLSLYEQYKEEGKKFIPKYKNLLKAGNSQEPKELLANFGFDILSSGFYKKGLTVIEEMVTEFEELAQSY